MDLSDVPAMMREVSRLLVQAEKSPNAQERADALTWLRTIRDKIASTQARFHRAITIKSVAFAIIAPQFKTIAALRLDLRA